MKHVGKRKVLISVMAMMLALVFTGAAFADSYPSPVFFLPSVNSRPEATTAPEETAAPEASTAPEETASPEATAAPEETADPEAAPAPEETVDPEATTTPEATVTPEATATPEETVDPEATVEPEPIPAPAITFERDEAGNLILDENGLPVAIVPEGMQAPTDYLRDENGAFILDENGNPIPVTPEVTPEPQPTDASSFNYERDEAGNLVLDENGNPIAIITDGMTEMPVAFQRDENGSLVLDENGNPIPTKWVPLGAQILVTIDDVLDPNRSVDIYAAWEGDALYFGNEARLIAVMNGYDEVVYSLQWQTSKDGASWTDVEGATETEHRLIVTEDNYLDYWRVAITITDVTEQAREEYLENNQQ